MQSKSLPEADDDLRGGELPGLHQRPQGGGGTSGGGEGERADRGDSVHVADDQRDPTVLHQGGVRSPHGQKHQQPTGHRQWNH